MNFGFKVIAFSFMLNFAVGIMLTSVPVFNLDPSSHTGFEFDNNQSTAFSEGLGAGTNPASTMQNSQNLIYRVLDMVTLGLVSTMKNVMDGYLYGVVNLFSNIFKGLLDEGTWGLFFGDNKLGIAYAAMTMIYVYGLFMLWTGKNNIFGD